MTAVSPPLKAQGTDTYRLYDGITAYVHNPDGSPFTVSLNVRDINIYESGPRELLFKVYDPDGRALVREVIPDDGVAARAYLPRIGGCHHEMWYYAMCYTRGTVPMIRWSDIQEHFVHAHHYGSYAMATWRAVVSDFADKRFTQVLARMQNLYAHTWCPDACANPWSARTPGSINAGAYGRLVGLPWKGEQGPPFTVSVNDGDEWFAARRKNYYVLTFHGRLEPTWLNHIIAGLGSQGLGGGICQLTVPARGTVLASTYEGYDYHYHNHFYFANWRAFYVHGVVGQMADGAPFVGANSEHLDAKLEGNTVTSCGEVRDNPVRVERRYVYEDDAIVCDVQVKDTAYRPQLFGMGRKFEFEELYEMIPFLTWDLRRHYLRPAGPKELRTIVTLHGANGAQIGAVTRTPTAAKTVLIDCGGYGVRIELARARPVMLAARKADDTLLVDMLEGAAEERALGLRYRLVPFGQ